MEKCRKRGRQPTDHGYLLIVHEVYTIFALHLIHLRLPHTCLAPTLVGQSQFSSWPAEQVENRK